MSSSTADQTALMKEVLEALKTLQTNQIQLAANVDAISGRVNVLAGMKEVRDVANDSSSKPSTVSKSIDTSAPEHDPSDDLVPSSPSLPASELEGVKESTQIALAPKSSSTSRIILTQSGINPLPMDWGNKDFQLRGPVVVSRTQSTIRRRNAHGGSYSIYYALAVASKEIKVDHRPDFTNTEPAANIGPFPQWADKKKIVSMDPLGHLSPWLFSETIEKENELEQSVREGRLIPDGKVCLNESGELAVTKFAVEPVWYLPGVAERFGIGGLTVYCFGDPAKMSDEKVKLALRVHDECNGSDVFGSDICTCRPYLIYGIEEAVKEAQKGGSGVVIYFRKEGRALGEVTKYLVYNARKRGADRASEYFKRTENIAGVKDMRFQALMPDILHWLGIKKIDRMLSMSK
ncbi:putative GTP cyclohydrolase [Lachnellula subtilissima]|uniref:Putative GTP cyclohydrolase n=2 Tax=Lachnellula TaxID=47830 RepID=A0A8H8S146_9HELO|nr:putative GTP cyclohydrolase [Lachnellula subtilissima]